MIGGLRSYWVAIPGSRLTNTVLFSIPIVNYGVRFFKELVWKNKVLLLLSSSSISDTTRLNEQRGAFQRDFLVGTGIQAGIAVILGYRIFSLPPHVSSKLTLVAFAIFGINAAMSLACHIYEGNLETIPGSRPSNILLFSIPGVNFGVRLLKERTWKKDAKASFPQMEPLNSQRVRFQRDFLVGMAIQAGIAMLCCHRMFSLPRGVPSKSALVTLAAFAIFGINAVISLPFHIIQANDEAIPAFRSQNS